MLDSLSPEELQFVKAIEKYKKENGKLFLSWTEVLKILKGLGYRRIAKKAQGSEEGTSGPSRRARKGKSKAKTTTRVKPAAEEARSVEG